MKRIAYLIALLIGGITMSMAQSRKEMTASRKLQYVEYAINELYVDKVDEDKLVEDAIRGMLTKLDPHSVYITAEEAKRANEPMLGNFEGIGIQYNMATDTLYIIQTISGGPSEKVGLMAGDKMIYVGDTLIAGVKKSNEDIQRMLRGEKGSKVSVRILRKGVDELIPYTIVRDKIPIYSVDAVYMVDKEVGYIRLDRFARTTNEEVKKALTELKAKGMKKLIFDLQGNGGGYLDAAKDVASQFLQSGELIVYTEGRKSARKELKASGNGLFTKGNLVVLVDQYSASASEIIAGAVQDWDRGSVVGRRTFGKGLVQNHMELPDGSVMRLTIARYFTPSGRFIQRPYESKESYDRDFIERYNKGELMHADSIHFPDSLQYRTLRKGRVVYGGGGIMPDYFVPIDTAYYSPYYAQMSARGYFNKLVTQLVDEYRADWKAAYPTVEAFDKQFVVTEEVMERFRRLGEEGKVAWKEEEYLRSLPMMRNVIKALIARDLWDMSAYFRIANPMNPVFAKGLELLKRK